MPAAGRAIDALEPEDEVLSAKQAVTRLKTKLMALEATHAQTTEIAIRRMQADSR
jgi:hypothetical protein